MDLGIGISLTTNIIAALKKLSEVNKALATIDLQELVVEMRKQFLEAKDCINSLKQENQELRSQLQMKNKLELDEDGNVFWKVHEGQKKGPYCSTCYGDEKKLISLSSSDPGLWRCPKCDNHFSTKRGREEQQQKHENLCRAHNSTS